MNTRMMFVRGVVGAAGKIVFITTVLFWGQVIVFVAASLFPTCVEKAVVSAFKLVYAPYLTLARRFIFYVMGEQLGNILLGFIVMFLGMFLYSILAAVVICIVSHVLRGTTASRLINSGKE